MPVSDHAVPWWPEPLAAAVAAADPQRWQSAGGDAAALTADLTYLLLEELAGPVAVLQRWAWPDADRQGRLVWRAGGPLEEVPVPQGVLRWQLYDQTALTRRPRPGDVFAVRWLRSRRTGAAPVEDLRTLFSDAYDVSADAREAARLAYGAALVPVETSARHPAEMVAMAASRRGDWPPAPRLVVGEPAGPGPVVAR